MVDPTNQATRPAQKCFAIVARFADPAALYQACEELRDAGYKNFDAHSPFPVHGLEIAMGVDWLFSITRSSPFQSTVASRPTGT